MRKSSLNVCLRALCFLIFVFAIVNTLTAFAGPVKTTYQAKIVKPDGLPLESNNVNFKFTILDTAGTCILYAETFSAVNMASTGGLVSFALGSGVKTYPVSSTTFEQVFSNITPSLSCDASGPVSIAPAANDIRKIVMQFHDGSGWQTLPAMSINAVPYAMYATSAETFGGVSASAYVQKNDLSSCPGGQALTYNGISFSCIAVGSSGSVSAAAITTALGYTPVAGASFTSLESTVAASFAAIASSQWVNSFNGSTSATQSFATGVTGTAFSISSANGVHTFNIPLASAASVTGGLVSNADYTTFMGKITSSAASISQVLGYTPANSATVTVLSSQVNSLTAQVSGVVSSQWTTSATTIRYNTGNVGIGTGVTDPAYALDVSGTTRSSKLLFGDGAFNNPSIAFASTPGTGFFNASGYMGFSVASSMRAQLTSTSLSFNAGGAGPQIYFTGGNAANPSYAFNVDSDTGMFNPNAGGGSNELGFSTSGTEKVRILSTGNVGIGTSAPVTKLEVSGGLKISMESAVCAVSYAGTLRYNSGNIEFCNGSVWSGFSAASAVSASTMSSTGNISIVPTGSLIVSSTTASTNSQTGALVVNGGLGVVGNINTAGQLNVSGSSVIDGSLKLSSMISGSVLFAGTGGTIAQDNATFFWDDLNNRLGLGTTAPTTRLEVIGTVSGSYMTSQNYSIQGGNGSIVILKSYQDSGGNGSIYIGNSTGGGSANGHNTFFNTAVGHNSYTNNTAGVGNSVFGRSTARGSSGSFNTIMGAYATMNGIGDDNVVLGAYAGQGSAGTNMYGNVLIGKYAGQNITTGANNTIIGYRAGSGTVGTGSNNILIGNNVGMSVSSTSNFINIGNTIYGSTSTGNVGIGVASPQRKLQVSGGGFQLTNSTVGDGVNDGFIMDYSSDDVIFSNRRIGGKLRFGTNGFADKLTIMDTGYVGIGTTAPTHLLHVSGTANSGIGVNAASGAISYLDFQEAGTKKANLYLKGTDDTFQINDVGLTSTIINGGGGNVGIGVGIGITSSTSRLTVATNNFSPSIGAVSAALTLQSMSATSSTLNTILWANHDGFANAAISTVQLNSGNVGNRMVLQTKSTSGGAWNADQVVLATTGNVGIGTSAPTQKLSVAGMIESTSGGVKFPDSTTQVTAAVGNPAGTIITFAGATCPSGYIAADGSAISRTTYANLFAAISTLYGTGDGSTTFNLPDLRGEFIRGWDNGRGVDTGRSIATAQADSLKAHTHTLSNPRQAQGGEVGGLSNTPTAAPGGGTVASTDSTGGSETRPRNIAMLYCIKN